MKYFLPLLFFMSMIFVSCETPDADWSLGTNNPGYTGPVTYPGYPPTANNPTTSNDPDSTILIDASRDGGVWWYPQAGPFVATEWHQGTALANYLRSFGFTIKELPRGATINWDEIKLYKNIIRFGKHGSYTPHELLAYDSFLNRSSSLILVSEHFGTYPYDQLASHLGLHFSGSYTGTVTPVNSHMITTGVSSLPYIAGSLIMQPDGDRMTILGNVNTSDPTVAYAAMGILHHPSSKIFFIGDGNGLQQLPQPFTQSLVKWLFNR